MLIGIGGILRYSGRWGALVAGCPGRQSGWTAAATPRGRIGVEAEVRGAAGWRQFGSDLESTASKFLKKQKKFNEMQFKSYANSVCKS